MIDCAVGIYPTKNDHRRLGGTDSLAAYLIHSENYRYNSRATPDHLLRRGFSTPCHTSFLTAAMTAA